MCDKLREGVLTITGGPNYESITELQLFKMLGVDCVGMSSIPESLTAHHCKIAVLAFCLVTNVCTTDHDLEEQGPNHEEVLLVAEQSKECLKAFVSTLVRKISDSLEQQGEH